MRPGACSKIESYAKPFFALAIAAVAIFYSTNSFSQIVSGTTSVDNQCGGSGADSNNCSQSRLLREGNTVYTVYYQHAAMKLRLVHAAFNASGSSATVDVNALIDDFKRDGTCLESDKLMPQGTTPPNTAPIENPCIKRLRRQVFDAEVRTRNTVLHNNDARRDMLNYHDSKVTRDIVPDSPGRPPEPAQSGSGATIMRDLNRTVETDPRTRAMRLLSAPQSVNFQSQPNASRYGDAVNGATLQTTQQVNVDQVNPDVAAGANTPAAQSSLHYTSDSDTQDSTLTNSVRRTANALAQDYQADRRAMDRLRPTPPVANSGSSGSSAVAPSSVSAEALRSVLNGIIAQGSSGSSGAVRYIDTPGPSGASSSYVTDTLDLTPPIDHPPGPSGSSGRTLDDTIRIMTSDPSRLH